MIGSGVVEHLLCIGLLVHDDRMRIRSSCDDHSVQRQVPMIGFAQLEPFLIGLGLVLGEASDGFHNDLNDFLFINGVNL